MDCAIEKNLDRFWNMLKKAYKEQGEEERLNHLKLIMFHNPKKAFEGPFVLIGIEWVSQDSSAPWIPSIVTILWCHRCW